MRIWPVAIGLVLISGAAHAQEPAPGRPEAPARACPPSGYAQPAYGTVGRNAGDGPAPTEAASPCVPAAVVQAAEAIGMARSQYGSPLSLKGLVTAMFTAEGTFALDGRHATPIKKLDLQLHYGLPAARLMITPVKGGQDIRVLNDATSWSEVSEGGAAKATPQRARELLILTKLTPFGAVWSVAEAEGHAKVTNEGGKTVISGASPYDGLPVSIVLDSEFRPEQVTIKDGSTVYTATFANYRDDLEPAYLFLFPGKMTLTKNGAPYADLTVTAYKSNPYVVFPRPSNVAEVKATPPPFPVGGPGYTPPPKRISPFAAYAAALTSNAPTPRAADGKPDLTGFWGNVPSPAGAGGSRRMGTFEPDQAALQRASGWEKPIYKPEYWDKVRSLDFGKVDVDPAFGCAPVGVPRQNAPHRILQMSNEIILWNGPRSRSALVGRQLTDEDLDQTTYDGISSARWDGDTLVIESTGFTEETWLQWQGYFHTDQMKVTERFWRKGDYLYYNFTVDDPDVLQEPWTQQTLVRRAVPPPFPLISEAGKCEIEPPSGDLYMRG